MPESISADSVREQVNRILSSEGFARAERLRRFLKFTVDRALGRSAELKEYLVGAEVFDKDASFDPRINTTVRVEARRLIAPGLISWSISRYSSVAPCDYSQLRTVQRDFGRPGPYRLVFHTMRVPGGRSTASPLMEKVATPGSSGLETTAR